MYYYIKMQNYVKYVYLIRYYYFYYIFLILYYIFYIKNQKYVIKKKKLNKISKSWIIGTYI